MKGRPTLLGRGALYHAPGFFVQKTQFRSKHIGLIEKRYPFPMKSIEKQDAPNKFQLMIPETAPPLIFQAFPSLQNG